MLVHACTLHQLGQGREHRRRIAAAGGRLAGSQADFALSPRETGHGIHQKQHALALVAKVFRDGRGHVRRLGALHRGFVAGGADDDALAPAFPAQFVLQELAHLPAALADQGHHGDIHVGALDQHAHQRGLAPARRREDAHALAFAASQHAVQRPHAQLQRLGNDAAFQGVRRFREHGIELAGLQRAELRLVQRAAQAIQHPAQQARAHRHHVRAAGRNDLGGGRDAVHVADRREQRRVAREAHHLALHFEILAGIAQDADLAHFHRRHHGLDDGADHLRDPPLDAQGRRILERKLHHLGDVIKLAHG
ncbi:hypothetical protein FQZ97_707640 [compost metagenome]